VRGGELEHGVEGPGVEGGLGGGVGGGPGEEPRGRGVISREPRVEEERGDGVRVGEVDAGGLDRGGRVSGRGGVGEEGGDGG